MVSGELYDIAYRLEEIRASSVLYFPFSLTILMTSGYLVFHRLAVRDKSIGKLIFAASLFFYIANVVRLVFFPLPISREYNELAQALIEAGVWTRRRHNLYFLDFMKWDNLWYWTTVGNFFLLFPLGFYLPLLFRKNPWNLFKVVFSGFAISLSIELLQLGYSLHVGYVLRSFDVDDLLLNTLGVLAGYLLFGFLWLMCKVVLRLGSVWRSV